MILIDLLIKFDRVIEKSGGKLIPPLASAGITPLLPASVFSSSFIMGTYLY